MKRATFCCPALMPEQLPAFTETISAASGQTSIQQCSIDIYHDTIYVKCTLMNVE
jgi:hypothetical protein